MIKWKKIGKTGVILGVCMAALMFAGVTGGMRHILAAEWTDESMEESVSEGTVQMQLCTEEQELKAGKLIHYRLDLENAGAEDLENIELSTDFPGKDLSARWDLASCLQADGERAVLEKLSEGEKRSLIFCARLTEEMEGELQTVVKVCADTGILTEKEISLVSKVLPAKADFTVEKTADCKQAHPGDAVTYQIFIRNTGERTLHSVVSTERFLNADIQAHFQEREGVKLNADRTKAFVEELVPGESVSLKADVTLPEELPVKNLINQISVTTAETGESAPVGSESEIRIVEETETISADEGNTDAWGGVKTVQAPKTGDKTVKQVYELLLILAWIVSAALIWHLYLRKAAEEWKKQ